MTSLFRDPELQKQFDERGFVMLPALSADAVERLGRRYDEVSPGSVSQMYSNVHDLAPEVNWEIAQLIRDELAGPIAEHTHSLDVRGGTFLVKGRGDDSACLLHQDWNASDETQHLALVAWVPLVDVDVHNGCLVVAPGTHDPTLFRSLRGANLEDPHFELTPELLELCETVPMRAGQVCVFAQNLFHGSLPNLSSSDRVALYAGLLPVGEPMVHFLRGDDGEVVRHVVDLDFFYSGQAAAWRLDRSPRPLVGGEVVHAAPDPVELDDLVAHLRRTRSAEPRPRVGRLRRRFSRR